MKLRDAIGGNRAMSLNTTNFEGREPEMVSAAAQVRAQISAAPRRPSELDLDRLHATFVSAAESKQWNNILWRDWRRGAWVLWHGDPTLADLTVFVGQYLMALERRKSARAFKTLIYVYLLKFDIRAASIKRFGRHIAGVVNRSDKPTLKQWQARHVSFQLFSSDVGPRELAHACLSSEEGPERCWIDAGLDGELSTGGFAKAGFLEALELIEERIAASPEPLTLLHRIYQWASFDGGLRFGDLRVHLVHALLRP